jgi:hypothetical protein
VERGNIRLLHGGGVTSHLFAERLTRNIMGKFIIACKVYSQRNLLQIQKRSITTLREIQPIILGALHGEMAEVDYQVRQLNLQLDRLNDTLNNAKKKVTYARHHSLKQAGRNSVSITRIRIQKEELQLHLAVKTYMLLSKEVDWMEEFTFLKPGPVFYNKE